MTPLQAARAAINRLETALLEPPLSFNHIVFPGFNFLSRPVSNGTGARRWSSGSRVDVVLAKEGDACARL